MIANCNQACSAKNGPSWITGGNIHEPTVHKGVTEFLMLGIATAFLVLSGYAYAQYNYPDYGTATAIKDIRKGTRETAQVQCERKEFPACSIG